MGTETGVILVVDDDEDILTASRLLLRRQFARVVTCSKPMQIPDLLAENQFDAVLLDMNFGPGQSSGEQGLEWLQRILAIDRFQAGEYSVTAKPVALTEEVSLFQAGESDTALLVFAGIAHNGALPFYLLHMLFLRLNVHVVYLTDQQKLLFAKGLATLGATGLALFEPDGLHPAADLSGPGGW